MSWFSIPKVFMAKTKAKAAEVNENFDAVEAALNGLFQAAWVPQTSGESLNAEYSDIPGASVSLPPTIPSLLIVNAVFDFSVNSALAFGALYVDGAKQAAEARLAPIGTFVEATVAQSYCVALAAGAHTVKLCGKGVVFEGGSADCLPTRTGFTYLLIPAP